MGETTLVIDVGTTATKVGLVIDDRLEAVASASNPPPTRLDDGTVEQDPETWWQSVVQAIGRLNPPAPSLIAVTGQMQNLITLDGAGAPLHPAILYADTRATAEHQQITAELGNGWEAAAGYQPDATALPAKYRWLRQNRPECCEAAAQALFGAHSFIVHRLCGVGAVDATTAGTTGLFDNANQTWWEPAADLVVGDLPAVIDPRSIVGHLATESAEALGMQPGTPVVHGPGDAGAATEGAVGPDGGCYVYVGTSGWAGQLTGRFEPLPGSILIPGPRSGTWVRAAPILAAGAVIEWAGKVLLGGIEPADLDGLIAGGCAADSGVWFTPALGGDSLGGDLGAAGSLAGLRWSTTASTVAAAVIEGVAHDLKRALAGFPGDYTAPLVATGGAMRLGSLAQAIADVCDRPVHTTTGIHTTLLGTAALALGADKIDPGNAAEAPLGPWLPRPAMVESHRRLADIRT